MLARLSPGDLSAPRAKLRGQRNRRFSRRVLLFLNDSRIHQAAVVFADGFVIVAANGPEQGGSKSQPARPSHVFPKVASVIQPHAALAFVKIQEEIAIRQICQTADERFGFVFGIRVASVFTFDAEPAEIMHRQAPLLQQARDGAAAPKPNGFVQVNGVAKNRADIRSFTDSRYRLEKKPQAKGF